MSVRISDVLKDFEDRAPKGTAPSWDNVGLLVGDASEKTTTAVVSIDLTLEAITAAQKKKAKLIVTHHPCIFPKQRGLSHFTAPSSSLAFEAARAGISVIACHTNFDQCALEVPEAISKGLGFKPMGRLHDSHSELKKLVVFIPYSHHEKVAKALAQAGAGHIGNYDSCSFQSEGEGRFRGNSNSKPFLGKAGELEKAREVRFETIFPAGLEARVLGALFRSHPYEEVAYDLYSVEQAPGSKGVISGLGYGVWGDFAKPKPFSEVAKSVTKLFQLKGYWVSDPVAAQRSKTIRRLAFAAGKGSSFLDDAVSQKCDLYITGEAGYHDALKGARRGMAVMEIGHRESEKFFLSTVKSWLEKQGLRVTVLDLPTQRIFTGET